MPIAAYIQCIVYSCMVQLLYNARQRFEWAVFIFQIWSLDYRFYTYFIYRVCNMYLCKFIPIHFLVDRLHFNFNTYSLSIGNWEQPQKVISEVGRYSFRKLWTTFGKTYDLRSIINVYILQLLYILSYKNNTHVHTIQNNRSFFFCFFNVWPFWAAMFRILQRSKTCVAYVVFFYDDSEWRLIEFLLYLHLKQFNSYCW